MHPRSCKSLSVSVQAFELDISKQLQAYEVEYHVFSEEMLFSPRPNHHPAAPGSGSSMGHPAVVAMQQTVRRLRQQNLELLEKLQRANSQVHSLQMAANEHRVNEDKQKSRIQALELERSALLTTVANLKSLIPESEQDQIPRMLQMQSLSASSSPALQRRAAPGGPVRKGSQGGSETNSVCDLALGSQTSAALPSAAGDGAVISMDGSATFSDTTDTICGTSSSSDKDWWRRTLQIGGGVCGQNQGTETETCDRGCDECRIRQLWDAVLII